MADNREDRIIKARILEPCLEVLESMARKQKGKGGGIGQFAEEKMGLEQQIENGDVVIPRVVVILGTRCTLRCRDCMNLMQYYDAPFDLEADDVLAGLEQFFSLVDVCMRVSLVGGEPFLYPALCRILTFVLKQPKVKSIELTTNGTIVPEEEVLKILAAPKIEVKISDYGNITDLSKLIAAFDKYQVRSECVTDVQWIDCGGCEPRNRTQDELEQLYMACGNGKMCKAVFRGKLFDCARAAHLQDLGYAPDLDVLDLYHCKKSEVFSFFTKRFARACDYCDDAMEEQRYIEPAVQMNGRHMHRSSHTLISRENYKDLLNARQYWEEQFYQSEEVVKELREWVRELTSAKEYFLQRIQTLEEQNARFMEGKK